MTTKTTISGDNWVAYNRDGFETERGVSVREIAETETMAATVTIGSTEHRRDELTISEDGKRIDTVHGWYLTRS